MKAKSGLDKSILDQGWFEFKRQLEYKSMCSGGNLVLVLARNTSREWGKCHHRAKENRRSQAMFKWVKCAHTENADVNASGNIFAAGRA